MNRDKYLPEQTSGLGTRQRRQIQRRTIAPPGQGTYYQEHPANPHRAGHSIGFQPQDQPFMTGDIRDQQTRHIQTRVSIPDEYDDEYPPRQHTSARRYHVSPEEVYQQGNQRVHVRYVHVPQDSQQQQQYLPPQRAAPTQRQAYTHTVEAVETRLPRKSPKQKLKFHWAVSLGLGMIVMLALVVVFTHLGNWWQVHQDDATYGRPRTFQVDAVVGHNDSPGNPSHFIASNLNRHIVVIELPGGDVSNAKIYNVTTLYGDNQDLTPVTLSFKDLNGDGKPDMLVHIQDQTLVFINDGGQFRPQKPGEHVTL